MPRRLLHIPRYTLRVALLAAVLLVLLFFALTRTQVGRDELRGQLERQFGETFEGSLTIGTLNGNLVNDLFATDVVLYAPDGAPVLHIDSVVARPRWSDLLRRAFSVRRLDLYRPRASLTLQADSTWNIARALQRTSDRQRARESWSFSSADLTIRDGFVQTQSENVIPPLIASGQVFDYTNLTIEGLSVAATVEWRDALKLLDVLHVSADLVQPGVHLEGLQGQIVVENDQLHLNQLALDLTETRLNLEGEVHPLSAMTRDSVHTVEGNLRLQNAHLDFDELRRLFPTLPLADAVDVAAEVRGRVDDAVLEWTKLSRGRTQLHGATSVKGLPESMQLDLALAPSQLSVADVYAVYPHDALRSYTDLDALQVSLELQGAIDALDEPLSPLTGAATFAIEGTAGRLSGTAKGTRTQSWSYETDVALDNLNLRRLHLTDHPTILSGTVRLEGQGMNLDDATLTAHLGRSLIYGRTLDSLYVRAEADSGQVATSGRVFTDRGWLEAVGQANLQETTPSYRLHLKTHQLDVGPLLAIDTMRTVLNAEVQLDGRGLYPETLTASLAVATRPTRIAYGVDEQTMAPWQMTAHVRPPQDAQPRLVLKGDLLDAEVDGDFTIRDLKHVASALRGSIQEIVDRRQRQTYDGASLLALEPVMLPTLDDVSPYEATLTLNLKQGRTVAAMLPAQKTLPDRFHVELQVNGDAEQFALSGTAHSDSVGLARFAMRNLAATFAASARLDTTLEASLDARIRLQADSLKAGATYPHPTFALDVSDRKATAHFEAGRSGLAGPARAAATLDLQPERLLLTLDDFAFTFGDVTWHLAENDPAVLYADALVVPQIRLEGTPDGDPLSQRLVLEGTLSNAPTDTFHVNVGNIALRQLTSLYPLQYPLDGRMNAALSLTNLQRPAIAGTVTVDTLSLNHHDLGQLTIASRFLPGAPDVALRAVLQPSAVESSGLERQENHLVLDGTLRLPSRATDDGGNLDLSLQIGRADPFFLELIFPTVLAEVRGTITGDATIQGSLYDPIFGGELGIEEGAFAVPRFNLAFDASGTARLEREGLMFENLRLVDKSGGTAVIRGGLLFNNYEYFSFDLTGQLDKLEIIDVAYSQELPFYGHIQASGNATLTGPIYNALLRSADAVTTSESELFIPLTEETTTTDPGFIVFADSAGVVPDIRQLTRRSYILASRPAGERQFVDGLNMDLNIFAPSGSTVHLVIDPLLGDVINAVGSGRVQLQRDEGEFSTYGTFNVDSGDYLFTASEVFVRRFLIENGTLTWDGDPLNARLDITASYRTRASRAGLPASVASQLPALIPLVVWLEIDGRVIAPLVDLRLAVDQSRRDGFQETPFLESVLNQPDRSAEYATSVLLTNSFLLTTEGTEGDVLAGSAFNSVSQLVASQLNRYLNEVLPNIDFSIGVQGSENVEDLDVTAGLAFRLLDERLVIRGEGVYRGLRPDDTLHEQQGLQGEFVVEVRLSPSVSVEVFYRREGDVLNESLLTNTTGASLSYQTQFPTWRRLFQRLFSSEPDEATADDTTADSTAPPS